MVVAKTPDENIDALAEFFDSVPHSEIILQVKQNGVFRKMSYRSICEAIGVATAFDANKKPTLRVENDGTIALNKAYLDICTNGFPTEQRRKIQESIVARIRKAGFCLGNHYSAEYHSKQNHPEGTTSRKPRRPARGR